MESIFGMESMAREAATVRMIQTYEKEIRDIARVSDMVRQAAPVHLTWYCSLLVRVGDVMVAFGTHLKARYAIQSRLRLQ